MSDALREVNVSVTQRHIDAGDRGSCRECPVALAVGELLKPGTNYAVLRKCTWYFDDEDVSVPHPGAVCEFTQRFDFWEGQSKPFTAVMQIPERFLRKEAGARGETP